MILIGKNETSINILLSFPDKSTEYPEYHFKQGTCGDVLFSLYEKQGVNYHLHDEFYRVWVLIHYEIESKLPWKNH